MSATYPILQVLQESRIGDEPMGTKAKFWWKDDDGVRWLFKFARPGTGEHWAEKVAAELAHLLGVPCPHRRARVVRRPGGVRGSHVPP